MNEDYWVLIRVNAGSPDEALASISDKANHILTNVRKVPEPATQKLTREEWPLWAKALAQLATLNDKGIGDVVARMIGDERSEKFKAWYLLTFGKPCGCNGRQKLWNTKYPLNSKAT